MVNYLHYNILLNISEYFVKYKVLIVDHKFGQFIIFLL